MPSDLTFTLILSLSKDERPDRRPQKQYFATSDISSATMPQRPQSSASRASTASEALTAVSRTSQRGGGGKGVSVAMAVS
jgi:hypothetical protein